MTERPIVRGCKPRARKGYGGSNPPLRKNPNRIMENYDVTRQNYESAADWHAEKSMFYNWSRQIDTFLGYLEPSPKLLDVGCGAGRDIEEFKKRGVQIEGIDYSPKLVEKLHRKFPDTKIIVADMRATSLPDNRYDGIWACASILNLSKSETPTILAEFKRLLKVNGKLFISVKEGSGEKMVPDKAGERFFSFFSEPELREIIKRAGFKILNTELIDEASLTGHSVIPTPPRWINLYAEKLND